MITETLENGLAQFYGSERLFRHTFVKAFLYTEGIQFLAEKAGAYWLLDLVAFNQHKMRGEEFQHWVITVKNGKAVIKVDDGNGNPLWKKNIAYTDFPLGEFSFYVCYNGQGVTAMLKSEY